MNIEIDLVKQWLEDIVIGLNLCPFAKPVFDRKQIHYVLLKDDNIESICRAFVDELLFLDGANPTSISTSILIIPSVANFHNYLDTFEIMDALLDQAGFRGIFQIASFHPDYKFANTNDDDVENYTNRAPLPLVHIIREDDVERARTFYKDIHKIPETNMKTLADLGHKEVLHLFSELHTKRGRKQ